MILFALLTISIQYADIVSVYDADTFKIDLPCDLPIACDSVPIRALGFDAPEIRGKCEIEKVKAAFARDITDSFLRDSEVIEIRNLKRGKYYRLIGDVYVDGYPLKRLHIKMGTGREYYGGKRQGWCD